MKCYIFSPVRCCNRFGHHRMSRQFSLWCGPLCRAAIYHRGENFFFFFLIRSHFHFQTELVFPCPYCSVMTYFDYVHQAGCTSPKLYMQQPNENQDDVKKDWNFHFGILTNWNPNTIKDKQDVYVIFQSAASFIIVLSWLSLHLESLESWLQSQWFYILFPWTI